MWRTDLPSFAAHNHKTGQASAGAGLRLSARAEHLPQVAGVVDE
jgi:hypothetical protein